MERNLDDSFIDSSNPDGFFYTFCPSLLDNGTHGTDKLLLKIRVNEKFAY